MIKVKIHNGEHSTDIIFPCNEQLLSRTLYGIGMDGEQPAPASMIAEIKPKELSMLENTMVNLDELNYLAKRMDGWDNHEVEQFLAIVSCKDLGETWDMARLINLTFSLPRYTLIRDTSNLESVGSTHLLNIHLGIPSEDMKNKEWLINTGKELLDSGKGIESKYGLIFLNEDQPFEDLYRGGAFPEYYYTQADTYVHVGYGEETELLALPDDDLAVKKALARLGAESLDKCTVDMEFDIDFDDDSLKQINDVMVNQDIYALNHLLKSQSFDRTPESQSISQDFKI